MNKIAFGAAIAAVSLALPGVAQAQKAPGAVIVVVDTDRVYRECTACKVAQTQLQSQVASARTRATQLGQPLQTEAQSIEQAGAALRNQTGPARAAAETALNTRVQQFQQRQTTAQQEVARLE
jgi:outer membrane protein